MPCPTTSRSSRFEHAFRAADQATIDELCDPGLVDHNPAPGHEPTLADFTRWVVAGSLQREFMGITASGQTIRVEGMNFYRLKDGRVTDIWTQFDGVAMMQQLGAIPA